MQTDSIPGVENNIVAKVRSSEDILDILRGKTEVQCFEEQHSLKKSSAVIRKIPINIGQFKLSPKGIRSIEGRGIGYVQPFILDQSKQILVGMEKGAFREKYLNLASGFLDKQGFSVGFTISENSDKSGETKNDSWLLVLDLNMESE